MEKNDLEQEVVVDEVVEETTEASTEDRIKELEAQLGRNKRQNTKLMKALASEDEVEEVKEETPNLSKESLSLEDIAVLNKVDSDVDAYHKLQQIAKLEGLSKTEALDSDIYLAWKSAQATAKKQQAASLGASKGSGSQKTGKTLAAAGLSKEDHKALIAKRGN